MEQAVLALLDETNQHQTNSQLARLRLVFYQVGKTALLGHKGEFSPADVFGQNSDMVIVSQICGDVGEQVCESLYKNSTDIDNFQDLVLHAYEPMV